MKFPQRSPEKCLQTPAWCTVAGWGDEHPSISVLNVAASVVACIAVVRETVIAYERRTVADLRAREVQRDAWDGLPPADGDPLDDAEWAAFKEITAHYDDRSAA
ncbi:hypothetical protein ACWCQZ_44260 [Streptomyces sp. NPDC002285]